MKVKKLIKKLMTYNSDLKVYIKTQEDLPNGYRVDAIDEVCTVTDGHTMYVGIYTKDADGAI